MNVADIGEFGLIELVAKTIRDFKHGDMSRHPFSPATALFPPPAALVDIGDDTAVWRGEAPLQLATTDTLVQDVHFSLSFATWRELGWKALAVNISDVAAMGGYPRYALITLGLPGDLEVEHIVQLYKGMMDVATRFGVAVVGGDMVRSKDVFVTIALTGEEPALEGARADFLLRSGAVPGDKVAVTGHLGSSAAGLKMLLEGVALAPEPAAYLREAHLRPMPRLQEGLSVRRHGGIAAMDVSDGLLADLTKVCQASGVGAVIQLADLPIHPIVRSVFPEEAESMALSGGEDYELLFTASEEVVEAMSREASVPVAIIGEITPDNVGRVRVMDASGREVRPRKAGWDHFKRG